MLFKITVKNHSLVCDEANARKIINEYPDSTIEVLTEFGLVDLKNIDEDVYLGDWRKKLIETIIIFIVNKRNDERSEIIHYNELRNPHFYPYIASFELGKEAIHIDNFDYVQKNKDEFKNRILFIFGTNGIVYDLAHFLINDIDKIKINSDIDFEELFKRYESKLSF